jgi:hypothetical protein
MMRQSRCSGTFHDADDLSNWGRFDETVSAKIYG